MDHPTLLVCRSSSPVGRRRRRVFMPTVRPLEGRQLLSGPTATMTQTMTFPDLEAYPTVADQAMLYFNGTMGTLTEVDLVTSGSFQTQFQAENLSSSGRTISGTTTGNLAINVPTGSMPVAIPPVTESFNASAFDGALNYGGNSGKTFAAVTSSSTPQTTVLTSPAALAAFTGLYRIPISVTGHAVGSVTPNDSKVAATFQTDTSATLTVVYHYIPNFANPAPSPANSPISGGGATNAAPITSTGAVPGSGGGAHAAALTGASTTQADQQHATKKIHVAAQHPKHPDHLKTFVRSHHRVRPLELGRHRHSR